MKVLPATVTVPSRGAPALAANARPTVALALPEAPLAMVIQGAVLAALHAQPLSVATSIGKAPPAAAIEASDGAMAYVHGAAAWLTGS